MVELEKGHASIPAGDLDLARVVGTCECGCGSIDIEVPGCGSSSDHKVACDGTGVTQQGADAAIMIWTTAGRLSGIEVYLWDGTSGPARPTPESLRLMRWGPDGKGTKQPL
jgi:hypothetical protein